MVGRCLRGISDLAISRRQLLQSGSLAAMSPALATLAGLPAIETARAETELPWRHALSLFGDVKYPPDFKRFDYVNPNAPKGGTVRQYSIGTFDNLNYVVSGVKGNIAGPVRQVYETLTTTSLDEVSTAYGLLAEGVAHPDDFSFVV